MWDDVVIGVCSVRPMCTSVTRREIGSCVISENGESYWVSNVIFGMGMKIMKDCEEGEVMRGLLDQEWGDDVVMEKLIGWFLKRVEVSKLCGGIERLMKREYERGRNDKMEEMRKVLGV